jgi:hypothetical protein
MEHSMIKFDLISVVAKKTTGPPTKMQTAAPLIGITSALAALSEIVEQSAGASHV